MSDAEKIAALVSYRKHSLTVYTTSSNRKAANLLTPGLVGGYFQQPMRTLDYERTWSRST